MTRKNKVTRRRTKRHVNKRKSKRYAKRTFNKKRMSGGYNPFIGPPYNASDVYAMGNYLPPSPNGYPSGLLVPPIPSNGPIGGGGKYKQKKYRKSLSGGLRRRNIKQRGGGIFSTLVPEDLLNMGRSIPAAAGHFMDKFNGVLSLPSSMVYPTQQTAVQHPSNTSTISPPNMNIIYKNALANA